MASGYATVTLEVVSAKAFQRGLKIRAAIAMIAVRHLPAWMVPSLSVRWKQTWRQPRGRCRVKYFSRMTWRRTARDGESLMHFTAGESA